MKCTRIDLGPDATAYICGSRSSVKKCQSPNCDRPAVALCDEPLHGKAEGKTCSRRACASCRVVVGQDEDRCPVHAKGAR